jgi:hypothetical protein
MCLLRAALRLWQDRDAAAKYGDKGGQDKAASGLGVCSSSSSSSSSSSPSSPSLASCPPRLHSPLLPSFVTSVFADAPVAAGAAHDEKVLLQGGGGRWQAVRRNASSAALERESSAAGARSPLSPLSPSIRGSTPLSRPFTSPSSRILFQMQQQQQQADHDQQRLSTPTPASLPASSSSLSPPPSPSPLGLHHPLLHSVTKRMGSPLHCNHPAQSSPSRSSTPLRLTHSHTHTTANP